MNSPLIKVPSRSAWKPNFSDGDASEETSELEAGVPMRDGSHLPSTDEILVSTAHELRLPLSHIKGFVSSLRRADVEWDDDARKEFLAEIDLETDRLAEVVESLLAPRSAAERGLAARVPARRSSPATAPPFNHPESVVQGALHRIRSLLEGRSLRLDVPPELPLVRMDASQIERLLANLIHNAIKYSPPATAIGVSARITDNGELELSVEDEGPGIPAEDRERIFEPFFRMRTAKQSEVPGYGLGLAICRSIVLAHGGRIQVSNRRSGGARFRVVLPAQVAAGQLEINYQPKEQANDSATDSAKNSGGR